MSTELSPQVMENLLGKGDLAKLSSEQRIQYITHVCQSLGLNPLTRPIRILDIKDKDGNITVVPYATKDCSEQLRKIHGVSIVIADKKTVGDICVITVHATDRSGRTDEDIGAVEMPKWPSGQANAIMKALTKAKRRVTLSICGLGFLDESEIETLPGKVTLDDEPQPPKAADTKLASVAKAQALIGSHKNKSQPPGPPEEMPSALDMLRNSTNNAIQAFKDCITQSDYDKTANRAQRLIEELDHLSDSSPEALELRTVLIDVMAETHERALGK